MVRWYDGNGPSDGWNNCGKALEKGQAEAEKSESEAREAQGGGEDQSAGSTGTPRRDGDSVCGIDRDARRLGPVTAQGLLSVHALYFQQILERNPSLSRFEMQRRAQAMVKDTIGKMLEQGLVESLADGAWEQYERLVRRGRRQMTLAMLKSPIGTIASIARAISLRFKRRIRGLSRKSETGW